jgi:hypothetical protein
MSYTTRLQWETLRSVDSAALSGSYVAIGGPLLHPSYILKLVNNSNVLVTVSIDGATDIDVCPASSFFLYDEDEGNNAHIAAPQGTQFFIKGAAGTGLIYLVSQYILVM